MAHITDEETKANLNAKFNPRAVKWDEEQMKEAMQKLVYEKDPHERQSEIKDAVKADPLRIVALRDPFPTNPSAAVKRLIELRKMDMPGTGERLFQEIALSAKSGDARRIAVSQVTNAEVLLQAADDDDPQVRFAVIEQTNDRKILTTLAEDKTESVQQAAKTKLSQPTSKSKKR